MKNAVNKMTNQINPCTENNFWPFIEIYEQNFSAVSTLALSDYHLLRRPLHGSLYRSCIAEVYPTLELITRPVPSRYPKFLSLPDPIPSRSQKPLPVSLWLRGPNILHNMWGPKTSRTSILMDEPKLIN